jgi:hypothetical protein
MNEKCAEGSERKKSAEGSESESEGDGSTDESGNEDFEFIGTQTTDDEWMSKER